MAGLDNWVSIAAVDVRQNGTKKTNVWSISDIVSDDPTDYRQALILMDGDLFDACLNLEQSFYESGYERGRQEGRVLGRDEGRILGMKEGWDIGFELGVYLGIAEALRSNRRASTTTTTTTTKATTTCSASETTGPLGMEDKTTGGARRAASERKLARLVDGVYDSLLASSLGHGREVGMEEGNMRRGDVHPRNEELQAYVQEVRAKFKMIAAMVGREDRRRISALLAL